MAGRPEDRAPRLDNPSEAGVLPDIQEGRDEGRVSSAAQGQDDDAWTYTTEAVNPNDPLIAWPRWREALRELTKPKYGVATMTVARKALEDE